MFTLISTFTTADSLFNSDLRRFNADLCTFQPHFDTYLRCGLGKSSRRFSRQVFLWHWGGGCGGAVPRTTTS